MNTMLSSEVWQDIQGYSGIYQVSTLGRTPKENANFELSIINRKRAMRKACGVSVNQYDLSGNYIATYATLTDAQTITGIAYQNIHACCIGRYKTAGNYIWKFNK